MKVKVAVQQDHLLRLAEGTQPLLAVAELVWNALDGDATAVEVLLIEGALQGLDEIRVSDNGKGIEYPLAVSTFQKLGDSWKSVVGARSPDGRRLHGSAGEGRFRAFALGSEVRWDTRWRDGKNLRQYSITANRNDLALFEFSDPTALKQGSTGTDVSIRGITQTHGSLHADDAVVRLAEVFALYLREYPTAQIRLDGKLVDPMTAQEHAKDYDLPPVEEDGKKFDAVLTVIEWNHPVDRELHLCDAGGCALDVIKPGIQARGFEFTAYIRSDYIRVSHLKGLLSVAELHPTLSQLVESAKATLREHFRVRLAEKARHVVEEWKSESIYPYEGTPTDMVEEAERQVFDVVALNINEYLPDFATSDPKSKKLSLHMLKTALERSPTEARRIVQEVLDLPKEKQEELVELLERTTLSSIINAARVVVDRLDFLAGLEVLLYDAVAKQKVKERKHLHRILADNAWIFGEGFNLTVDDQGLTEVLRKHVHLLGKERKELAPVTTVDGEQGIVDLMLSRRVPQAKPEELEHLVIELKRPKVVIDEEVVAQVKKYAHAVAHDERFRDTGVRWIFWAVSNEMHDTVRWEVDGQKDRPAGCLLSTDSPSTTIWIRTWGQIIAACRGRLQFFQSRLDYMAKQDAGLEYVQKVYSKYLPPELKKAV